MGTCLDGVVASVEANAAGSKPLLCLLGALKKAQEGGERDVLGVNLSKLNVSDADVEVVVDALVANASAVREVALAYNHIGDVGAAALTRLLRDDAVSGYRCVLSSIDLRGNEIGTKGCEMLMSRLQGNASVTTLVLDSNPLGHDGGLHIGKMLEHNFTVERLHVSGTEMTEAGFVAVVAALRSGNNTVRELRIGRQLLKSLQEVAVRHVADMLQTHPCMVRLLDLSKCKIGDEGAGLLQRALFHHPTMSVLDLSCNHLGILGGEALATLLLEGSNLTCLKLRGNRIGDDGARAFKAVLHNNRTLKRLDLRSNDIRNDGLQALAQGMEYNATLEEMTLWGNHFGQAALKAFDELRAGVHQSITGLRLDIKPFVVDGVYEVARQDCGNDQVVDG